MHIQVNMQRTEHFWRAVLAAGLGFVRRWIILKQS
jgi:hypothetical protein